MVIHAYLSVLIRMNRPPSHVLRELSDAFSGMSHVRRTHKIFLQQMCIILLFPYLSG